MQRTPFRVGQKVMCNGFPGTVASIYEGDGITGMVEVRLASGLTVVGAEELYRHRLDGMTRAIWNTYSPQDKAAAKVNGTMTLSAVLAALG